MTTFTTDQTRQDLETVSRELEDLNKSNQLLRENIKYNEGYIAGVKATLDSLKKQAQEMGK